MAIFSAPPARRPLGITRVLEWQGILYYPDVLPAEERLYYMSRGAAFHRAAALWDADDLDMMTVAPEISGGLAAYQRFRDEQHFVPAEVEKFVTHASGRYHGRLDRVGAMKAEPFVVLDLKFGNTLHPATAIQTAAVNLCLPFRHKRFGVLCKPDGTYKLDPYVDDPGDEGQWWSALANAEWRRARQLLPERKGANDGD